MQEAKTTYDRSALSQNNMTLATEESGIETELLDLERLGGKEKQFLKPVIVRVGLSRKIAQRGNQPTS